MIGICDWGIGGIGVLKELNKNGSFNFVYLSDSGFTPYGKVPEAALRERWRLVKEFLEAQGATKIVVACNALSTVIDEQKGISTIIDAGKKAIQEVKGEKIGIVGGNRTIDSAILQDFATSLGRKNIGISAQKWSARIEKGDLDSQELIADINEVMNNLEDCSSVILACTHYPAITPILKRLYPEIDFIDPANYLTLITNEDSSKGVFYTTGDHISSDISSLKSFDFRTSFSKVEI